MRRTTSFYIFALSVVLFIAFQGCQNNKNRQGIHVFFESPPSFYQQDVYWFGQAVGKIVDQQVGRSSVARITVQLDPQFEKRIGKNWAFFVEQGRLTACQLSLSGDTFAAGDNACGFNSKAALNWFKLKTLLNDRVGAAMRKADRLQMRFG